jgi:putative radical SAM enzyme (TIGR03279 family)
MKPRCSAEGVVVAAVRARTPAADAGLAVGDRIVSINGHAVRDAIDFQFHAADERLSLTVERGGARHALRLVPGTRPIGVTLEAPRPGEIATCANKCVFCFIHQLPKGMRKSLYVKDDDFRLSFLHGNYITLTDLDEAELARIERQRLSPLYVSVHATDPALRWELLGRPRASAEILPRLERLANAGIRMHAQIVLCPDWNDGAQLERTVHELAPLHPQVATTAIVPVGLTAHRERLPSLRTLTDAEARALVDTVHGWQGRLLSRLGTRFVFLGDEVYLQAGARVPEAAAYEGFPVAEDGIGLVRRFEDGFARASRPVRSGSSARVTVVSGTLYAPRLARLVAALPDVRASVVAVPNRHFGGSVSVAGLLTGGDIQRHLAKLDDLGDAVLVPAVAVRDGDGVFLDDVTPADLARDLGVPVQVIEPEPSALFRALYPVLSRRGTASPGRAERGGAWGAISEPPTT